MTMKKNGWIFKMLSILLAGMLVFAACGSAENGSEGNVSTENRQETQGSMESGKNPTAPVPYDGVVIALSDDEITVDGEPIGTDEDAVYAANDIV